MRKKTRDALTVVVGALTLCAGLVLLKQVAEPQGILRALPYLLIGLGCGVFGHGMGEIIGRKAVQRDPEAQRRMEIEKSDERNVAIANRAKAKAYDLMIFVFGALMFSFALMNVDLVVVLLLVFAYLVVVGCGFYYRIRYEKEM